MSILPVLKQMSALFFSDADRILCQSLLFWGVCKLLISDRLLAGVIVLISGMPVASNIVMLCNELSRDGDYIAKGVFFSTLFSVVTIPVIALLL